MEDIIKQLRKASIIILDQRQKMCGPSLEVKTAQGALMKSLSCISNAIAELQVLDGQMRSDKK